MKTIDLLGKRFGRLVVTGKTYKTNSKGHTEMFWECQCDCGNTTAVRSNSLRKAETRSCGCFRYEIVCQPRKNDLVGLRFGRLLVIERLRRVWKSGRDATNYYRCKCDCGVLKVVQSSNLRSGGTKSCGCLLREMLPHTKYRPGSHFVIRDYKKSSKSRKLEWGLSDQEAISLLSDNCHYCDSPPSKVVTPPDRKVQVTYAYNGIDRIDSSMGYITGNVVACCTRCNYSKRNYSYEEFLEMAEKVYLHRVRLHKQSKIQQSTIGV